MMLGGSHLLRSSSSSSRGLVRTPSIPGAHGRQQAPGAHLQQPATGAQAQAPSLAPSSSPRLGTPGDPRRPSSTPTTRGRSSSKRVGHLSAALPAWVPLPPGCPAATLGVPRSGGLLVQGPPLTTRAQGHTRWGLPLTTCSSSSSSSSSSGRPTCCHRGRSRRLGLPGAARGVVLSCHLRVHPLVSWRRWAARGPPPGLASLQVQQRWRRVVAGVGRAHSSSSSTRLGTPSHPAACSSSSWGWTRQACRFFPPGTYQAGARLLQQQHLAARHLTGWGCRLLLPPWTPKL
jgi:hypothetical protein